MKKDNSALAEPAYTIKRHAAVVDGSNWTDLELVSQITVIDRHDPILFNMISLIRNRLCKRIVEAWTALKDADLTEARHKQELRDAFKAGWRTNADIWQDAAYLDGCEQTDYEDYERLGLAAFLDTLKDVGETMDTD